MDRNDIDWRGYWPASPTPFREDGAYDADAHRDLLEHYIATGVHGVFVNGTTGEWFSQTGEERRHVARTCIDAVAGRVPVVIGCTAYTATEVAALARDAMDAGASGVATTPPPYSRPLPDEIVAFFEDIARALPDVPVMVYNWPHGTSVDIDAALADRLAGVDTVVAIKDSTPNVEQFYVTARTVVDRVRVIGPFMTREGHRALTEHGGDGTIGGGSLLGADDPAFWDAHWRGDHETCLALADRIERLFAKLWLPGGWCGVYGHYQSQLKALMAMLGQPGGTVRPPRLPVTDPAALAAMRQILAEEGLLSVQATA
jgi:1-pyrroline-4-hydroxy-2-carboxylate deaminase